MIPFHVRLRSTGKEKTPDPRGCAGILETAGETDTFWIRGSDYEIAFIQGDLRVGDLRFGNRLQWWWRGQSNDAHCDYYENSQPGHCENRV